MEFIVPSVFIYGICLLVFAVISSIAAVVVPLLRGRRRRRILPLPFSLFGLGSRLNIHENDVHADFCNFFQFNKEICLPESESSATGDDNSLHSTLGKAKYHVADAPKPLAVANIYDFFSMQFTKARFHTLFYATYREK